MRCARTLIASSALPVVLAAGASALRAQPSFEGTVTYKTTLEGKTMESTYYTKGQRQRQEFAMGANTAVTITDFTTGKSMTLIPAQKKYMVMDYKAMAEAVGPVAEAIKDKKPKPDFKMPAIEASGKTETIAGHSCQHYTLSTDQGMEMDFCVAKGMGSLGGGMGALAGGGAASSGAMADPRLREFMKEFKDGFFPLRTSMSKGGKVVMVQEAVKIEAKPLSNDLFSPPADYTELKIPGVPGKRP